MKNPSVINGNVIEFEVNCCGERLGVKVSTTRLQVMEDYKGTWYGRRNKGGLIYVTGWIDGRNVKLHRYLLGAKHGQQGDHIDGNTLNNCDDNLRIVNNKQNNENKRISSSNTSGYVGVVFSKGEGAWQSRIDVNGKRVNLGYYKIVEVAGIVSKLARVTYFTHSPERQDLNNIVIIYNQCRGAVTDEQIAKYKNLRKLLSDAHDIVESIAGITSILGRAS